MHTLSYLPRWLRNIVKPEQYDGEVTFIKDEFQPVIDVTQEGWQPIILTATSDSVIAETQYKINFNNIDPKCRYRILALNMVEDDGEQDNDCELGLANPNDLSEYVEIEGCNMDAGASFTAYLDELLFDPSTISIILNCSAHSGASTYSIKAFAYVK